MINKVFSHLRRDKMPGIWRDWPFFILFPGVIWLSWTLFKKIPWMCKFTVIAEGTYKHSNHRCLKFRPPTPSPFPEKNPEKRGICFRTIHFEEEKGKYYFVRDVCELSAKPGARMRILGNGRGEYKIEFPEESKDPA